MDIEKTNILIVDDERPNLQALKAVLDDPSYNLVSVSSGKEALRHLLRGEFALVLLDVQMPDMDGFETAQAIRGRERTRLLPIIFITGRLKDTHHISKAYSVKAIDYILKPFDPEILRTKVSILVELNRKTSLVQRQATLLRKSEEELRRSNQELEQFAYVVSHDLQAPLRSISGFLNLFQEKYIYQLNEEATEYIELSAAAAKRMKSMIGGLLTYSRVGSIDKQFQIVDCKVIVSQVLENLQADIEENGAVVTQGLLPKVVGDPLQLMRLFQNLIGNALKFRGVDLPQIQIAASKKANFWEFSIKDNGIGINPKNGDRIFGIFQRLHTQSEYPGDGIGLAICNRIVQRHNGTLWIESELGEGTTFYFNLPESSERDL